MNLLVQKKNQTAFFASIFINVKILLFTEI